jgi:hypothetical protein
MYPRTINGRITIMLIAELPVGLLFLGLKKGKLLPVATAIR